MATMQRKHFYWAMTSVFALLLSVIPFCVEVVIAVAVFLAFPELKGQFEPTFPMIIIGIKEKAAARCRSVKGACLVTLTFLNVIESSGSSAAYCRRYNNIGNRYQGLIA